MACILKLLLALVLVYVVASRVPSRYELIDDRISDILPSNPRVSISRRRSDRVIYKRDQGTCVEETKSASRDCRWPAGLYPFVDQLVKKGRIIAYKIRWFNGSWSGWYVPGVNDIDLKFNPSARTCSLAYKAKSMRRMWSYFYDHTHKYIICKN